MKEEIYRRLIVLMALRVDVNSELFQGTIRLAVSSALAQNGAPTDTAFALADMIVPLIAAEIAADREMMRIISAKPEQTPCEKPECAACRVRNWAKTSKPIPEAIDADLERKIRDALSKLDRKGPAN